MEQIIPNHIKFYREQKGLSRKELAELLNKSENIQKEESLATTERLIRNWENGKSKPREGSLQKLTSILECTVDSLYGYIDCSNHDIQYIHDVTGLSEKAILRLKAWNDQQNESSKDSRTWAVLLSKILEDDRIDDFMDYLYWSTVNTFKDYSWEKAFQIMKIEQDTVHLGIDMKMIRITALKDTIGNILSDIIERKK